ncbi:AIG2-like protein [Achaetomium macrosporum]|uniref:Putative gamma-glutamylcyclotransferase n=1 Tax=Achaetomium macrosporum TaxID=79813 RepID=A0AAN7C880_9PEZI|nr:AIG2-like protein [Achaetomium macrosporum]
MCLHSTCDRLQRAEHGIELRIKMVEAINSGRLALYCEPESPPNSKDTTVSAKEPLGGDQDISPCILFVYGTLMDPEMLMAVAGLAREPRLQNAWIEAFGMKMWNGIYPAALPPSQCLRLQRYETSAYEPADCQIHVRDNAPVKGLVFKCARDPTSSELVEGAFDLEHWQMTHKRSAYVMDII